MGLSPRSQQSPPPPPVCCQTGTKGVEEEEEDIHAYTHTNTLCCTRKEGGTASFGKMTGASGKGGGTGDKEKVPFFGFQIPMGDTFFRFSVRQVRPIPPRPSAYYYCIPRLPYCPPCTPLLILSRLRPPRLLPSFLAVALRA